MSGSFPETLAVYGQDEPYSPGVDVQGDGDRRKHPVSLPKSFKFSVGEEKGDQTKMHAEEESDPATAGHVWCVIGELCNWQGEPALLSNHLDTDCPDFVLNCENANCGEGVPRGRLKYHTERECRWRTVHGPCCGISVLLNDLEAHRGECPDAEVTCQERSCKARLARKQLEEHRKLHSEDTETACPLGCGSMVRLGSLKDHAMANTSEHMHLIYREVQTMKQEMKNKDRTITELRSELAKVGQRHSELMHMQCVDAGDQRKFAEHLQTELYNLEVQMARKADENEAMLHELEERVMRRYDPLVARVSDLEDTASDGTLIWRCGNVNEHIVAAMRPGREIFIQSCPFFTSQRGYKLCVRLYPFGRGRGHTKYMSVSVCLMAGRYDPVLQWPFRRNIAITLLDQSRHKEHIEMPMEIFQQQPTLSSEEACGPCIPCFAEISRVVGDLALNDTIFIKAKVWEPDDSTESDVDGCQVAKMTQRLANLESALVCHVCPGGSAGADGSGSGGAGGRDVQPSAPSDADTPMASPSSSIPTAKYVHLPPISASKCSTQSSMTAASSRESSIPVCGGGGGGAASLDVADSNDQSTCLPVSPTSDDSEFTCQLESTSWSLDTGSSSLLTACAPQSRRVKFTIPNYREVVVKTETTAEARFLTFQSQPFYTNKTGDPGYKMKLLVYPGGFHTGKGQSLSFYIVVMRGKFDDRLTWPCTCNITLTLKSSKGTTADIAQPISEQGRSVDFHRPEREENRPSGFAEFASLKIILEESNGFIRDGNITLIAQVGGSSQPPKAANQKFQPTV